MAELYDAIRDGISDKNFQKLYSKKKTNVNMQEDGQQQTLLHVATGEGQYDISKFLLKKGADVNLQDVNGWTALHFSASGSHFKVCELLLSQKNIVVNVPNIEQTTALHYMVRRSGEDPELYRKILKLMSDKKVQVNAQNLIGEGPLHSACLRGNVEAVRFLLEHKADPNLLTG
jgi:ankyrin repeat protein